jgi:hypothetical protein
MNPDPYHLTSDLLRTTPAAPFAYVAGDPFDADRNGTMAAHEAG